MLAAVLDNVLGLAFMIDPGYGPAISMGYGWLYLIYTLAVFLPSLAVSVRRLHDVGKSGWFLLICAIPLIGAIWLLVLFASTGQEGENQYG